MIVSFLMPHELHGLDARHLLVFYKQLQAFGRDRVAFVGSPAYFRHPDDHRSAGRREWLESWRALFGYEPPSDLDGVVRHELPADLFTRRLARVRSPLRLYRQMLTSRLPELEEAFGRALDDLGRGGPIEAVLLFANVPSVEQVARRRGIPVVHNEVGPLRTPTYAMTAYWDRSGVNGRTEAARRFRRFRRELGAGRASLLSREELLRAVGRSDALFSVADSTPRVPVGIALQIEDDSNIVAFSNGYGSVDLIDMARARFGRDQVLIRHHPGGLSRYADSLGLIDDSPDSVEFIRRSATVMTVNSSVALETLLLGRRAVLLGDSPFRIAAETTLSEAPPPAADRVAEALNFLVFGYLVPYPLAFDEDYLRWRLEGPSELEIAAHHQRWYRDRLPSGFASAPASLTLGTAAKLLPSIRHEVDGRPLVVFGAGSAAGPVVSQLRLAGLPARRVFDNDPGKWGSSIAGVTVAPPSLIDDATVVVASLTHAAPIRAQLCALGYRDDRVVSLTLEG